MRRFQRAFTLIELMVTVAVLATVLAIAIPSFTTQIRNNQSVALGEELASAINFARSEAVKRGARVSVCASSNGTSCVGAWNTGWIVFVDSATVDNAGTPVIAASPADGVLRYWGGIDNRASIAVSNSKTFFRYTGLGTLARVDTNPVVITARFTGCKNNAARTITVGLSGIVNVDRAPCP